MSQDRTAEGSGRGCEGVDWALGPLHYKADWPRAVRRWDAYWDRSATDRPLMCVRAPSGRQVAPPPPPSSDEVRWVDADYVAARWRYILEASYFGGESPPTAAHIMAGWTLGCGAGVGFDRDTVWHSVTLQRLDQPGGWRPGATDPWRAKVERLVRRLLDDAPGRFLATYAIQLPVNDLVTLLRGVEDFMLDWAEDPRPCLAKLREWLPLWLAEMDHFRAIVESRQAGCTWGWPGLWSRQFVLITQSDMSCMISGSDFEKYVLAEMDVLAERYGRLWYHVDGPLARRHVPALLTRPGIVAIQYVAGDGQVPNGPHYLDLYRQVQAAGRCLDLEVPLEHVEFLVRHLRPEGLLIRTYVDKPQRADELLDQAVGWCGTHVGRA